MTVRSYRDLAVWQAGMDLTEMVYLLTRRFPASERYGLVSQMRRAAVSVPANIAEGHGREHTKEFLNHLSISRGSLMELETHLLVSQRVGLIGERELAPLLDLSGQISKMISGLRRSLRKRT